MTKVRFETDGQVGIMTICDPPLNLVSLEIIDGLEQAIVEMERAPIRAALVRAEGEHFSAGANVGDMFQGVSAAQARLLLGRVGRNLHRVEQLPFPTIAAVHGLCLAAGLEIALACDLIWAADSAQLGLVEAVIGAVPFGGGAQRLAERAGVGRAREAVMTGGVYDAETFARWNVINRVVPGAELADKTLRFAHRLAAGATLAHGATKRVLRAYLDQGTIAADTTLLDAAPALFETDDMQGGIASLLEQGPGNATFAGR